MFDLSEGIAVGPGWQTLPADPGLAWKKDEKWVIDAAPDDVTDPPPEAREPALVKRTGVCGAVAPRVIALPGGGFRLYYTQILPRPGFPAGAVDYGNATSRILSAFSSDGTSWQLEPGVRLSAAEGGAGAFRVVSSEVVPIFNNPGRLRMYYECSNGPQTVGNSIRSACSSDGGLVWIPEPGICLGDNGRNYMTPRILLLDDGRCRLFCGERGRGIISALSDDGRPEFHEEPGTRIAPGGPYDHHFAFAPEIIRLTNGTYVMYYAGYSVPTRAHILRAVSDDGLVWSKDSSPVISPGRDDLSSVKCSEMCVVKLPRSSGAIPQYRMFYEACDGTAEGMRGVWRIHSATAVAAA